MRKNKNKSLLPTPPPIVKLETPSLNKLKNKYQAIILSGKEKLFTYEPRRKGLIREQRIGLINFRKLIANRKRGEGHLRGNIDSSTQHAKNLAEMLAKQHNVQIEVIPTNEEYSSEKTIERGLLENTYFISAESPENTADKTEHLIKYNKIKYRLLVDKATAKRVERSQENNSHLLEKIEEIRKEYKSQTGKEPAKSKIAQILNERNIDSPGGKDGKWQSITVKRILDKTESQER